MSATKIQSTHNYRLFERHSSENRPLDIKKHKKLSDSMRLYGFLRCFPVVVVRNETGQLIVKDGQHRLAIAEELGLEVYWIEESVDFDVAIVNSTSRVWVLRDYAQKYAANGLKSYQEGIDFAERHALPIGTAFALLSGLTAFSHCEEVFMNGTWKVKDRGWADAVAGVYGPLVQMAPQMRNARLIEACMAVCRVDGFDGTRLLHGAGRCREKLVPYSNRDSYLDMFEQIYNFNRSKLVGLKAAALMAMRKRNPIIGKKQKSAAAEKNGVLVPV